MGQKVPDVNRTNQVIFKSGYIYPVRQQSCLQGAHCIGK